MNNEKFSYRKIGHEFHARTSSLWVNIYVTNLSFTKRLERNFNSTDITMGKHGSSPWDYQLTRFRAKKTKVGFILRVGV